MKNVKRGTHVRNESPSTLKRILKYVGKYPLALIGSLLLAVVSVVASLLIPVFFGDAVDCILESGILWEELFALFLKIGVALGVGGIAQWLMSLCNNHLSACVVRDIRESAFDKLGKLPLQYIDTHSHGDTVSRIVSDADQFSDGLLMGFTQFFTGILTILGTIAFMLVTNLKIGIVVVLVTPASLFVARFVAKHTHQFFEQQTQTRGEQTAFASEMIGGLKTVQAFAQEESSAEKFDEINARLQKASMNATFYSSLTNPSTRFINNLVCAFGRVRRS